MQPIPTAKEFLEQRNVKGDMLDLLALHLTDFAKLHHENQLEAITSNVRTKTTSHEIAIEGQIPKYVKFVSINKDSIKNAYPITNIK